MNTKIDRSRHERKRPYLEPAEVSRLLDACRKPDISRNPERDYCLLLLMFHHGLRVSEACQLTVDDVELENKLIHIKRLKNGKSISHPFYTGDLQALRNWLAIRAKLNPETDYLFISERRGPLHRATVWALIQKAAETAGLSKLHVHPHMLRHSAGFYLANRTKGDLRLIQSFLGHRNIQNTTRYTETDPNRFAKLF
jgi:integrase